MGVFFVCETGWVYNLMDVLINRVAIFGVLLHTLRGGNTKNLFVGYGSDFAGFKQFVSIHKLLCPSMFDIRSRRVRNCAPSDGCIMGMA